MYGGDFVYFVPFCCSRCPELSGENYSVTALTCHPHSNVDNAQSHIPLGEGISLDKDREEDHSLVPGTRKAGGTMSLQQNGLERDNKKE